MPNEAEPGCLSACDSWKIVRSELKGHVQRAQNGVHMAEEQERYLRQQMDESDGGDEYPSLRSDAEFNVMGEQILTDAADQKLINVARGCRGQECAIARFCISQYLEHELHPRTD